MVNTATAQSSANIKGGGRVSLSEDAEHALIDCLMKRQKCWPFDDARPPSAHELKRERKRFVKRLVERHGRERIHQRLNSGVMAVVEKEEGPTAVSGSEDKTSRSSVQTKTSSMAPSSSTSGKVRVELMEAIFNSSSSSATNKNKGDVKKSGKATPFKQGAKKLLVLPRATTVDELLGHAQAKLRMKQKPVRIFVMENTQQVDLLATLAGVTDGAVLFVTSSTPAADPHDDQNEVGVDKTEANEKEEEGELEVDPLDAVKQMYSNQQRGKHFQRRGNQQADGNDITLPVAHPNFSDHWDSLPALSESSSQLPAANSRMEILQAVQDHRVVVICGATGCGKSTQVPQFLRQGLQACSSNQKNTKPTYANIIVTQPRRVAATAWARRVSQEMSSPLTGQPGSLVGHHVRLDRALSDTAQIMYCTVGILLRRLVAPSGRTNLNGEPSQKGTNIPLEDVTHVVVDEVHERDVNIDFLLTLLLHAVLPRNPQLRIILMSATASTRLFVNYFGSYRPVVLSIPGRTFPVETKWLDVCQRLASQQLQNYHDRLNDDENAAKPRKRDSANQVQLSPRAADKIDYSFIQRLIASIVQQQQANGELSSSSTKFRSNGAILVFLPGKAEIEATFRAMTREPRSKDIVKIYKLYSGVPRGAQQEIFDPAASGTVKIVLATNIAETSITIPDVSHVIDTGRVKESRYNSETRIKELVTVWTSQASAQQRAGRAGRTTNGTCYRLYSGRFHDRYMLAQTPPEMVRTPLDGLILQLCLLYEQRRDEQQDSSPSLDQKIRFPKGANPVRFLSQVPEPPPTTSLEQACQHLLDVDALHVVDVDSEARNLYRLTPLGFHLSRLPMDAKVGKTLIVGCLLGCLEGALTVAATLSGTKSCFYNKFLGNKQIVDHDYEIAVEARNRLIKVGFGGKDWRGGTSKGDLIAAIACYREWAKQRTDKERFDFACKHALDHVALREIQELRSQYLDLLVDAGFSSSLSTKRGQKTQIQNRFQDDALLTSCCLVAGLYPNVCTLVRPRKGGPKGGRLLTKEGDSCRPQMQSFQRNRVQNAAETGKDAYAVYHTKYRSVGTGNRVGEVVLSEVNFVPRYALLLFSGDLEIVKNAVILDGWLKFKIGEEKLATGAVLLLALRKELDMSLLQQISQNAANEDGEKDKVSTNELMHVVLQLLAEE